MDKQQYEAELLTPREEEVLKLLLMGLSNRDIKQKLMLTDSGVEFHARNIYSKKGVKNRRELMSLYLSARE